MRLDNRDKRVFWIGFLCLISVVLASTAVGAWAIEQARLGRPIIALDQKPEAVSTYTGLPITKRQSEQRAIGVMIADDPITRPQSGIGEADIVVEMEAAPGITRLLAIFSGILPDEIGSIRSARNDYIDIAAGFDAVLVHWGGEKRALDRLASSDTAEIDQFANGDLFYRKLNVPPPHNGFTTGDYMQEGLKRYDYDRVPDFDAWSFVQEAPLKDRPSGGTLDLTYGSADFNVEYAYDQQTNTYLRSQGGVEHKDLNTDKPAAPKNVLVMRADHFVYSSAGSYLQFDLDKGGACSLYQNGQEFDCRWDKGSDENDPILVTDRSGKALPFVKGQTWIQVMLPDASVKWTPTQKPATLDTNRQ